MGFKLKMKNLVKKGFTLIEVILYMGILVIFLGGAVSIGWGIVFGSIKTNVHKEVSDNLALFEKKFRYEVMNASAISITESSVQITPADTSRETVVFEFDDQKIMYGEGDSGDCSTLSLCPLSSANVLVTNLTFEDLSNPIIDSKLIKYSLTVKYNTTSSRSEWNYENSLTSSVETRGL